MVEPEVDPGEEGGEEGSATTAGEETEEDREVGGGGEDIVANEVTGISVVGFGGFARA